MLALIGVLITNSRTKKNIRMQARIEWIQEVRKQTIVMFERYKQYRSAHFQQKGRLQAELNFQSSLRLLKLYFAGNKVGEVDLGRMREILSRSKSNKGKNGAIRLSIDELLKFKDKDKDALNKPGESSEYYVEMINFMDVISLYLKIEWDKAKKGK